MQYLEMLVKSSCDDVKIEHTIILSDKEHFFTLNNRDFVSKAIKRACRFPFAIHNVHFISMRIISGFNTVIEQLGYATVNNNIVKNPKKRYFQWIITIGKDKATVENNVIKVANSLYDMVSVVFGDKY